MKPPLRFLALVLGGWIAVRAAMLVPDWTGREAGKPDPTATTPLTPQPTATRPSSQPPPLPPSARSFSANPLAVEYPSFLPGAGGSLLRAGWAALPEPGVAALPARTALAAAPTDFPAILSPEPSSLPSIAAPARPVHPPALPAVSSPRRWSVSAWLLLRDDRGGASLAPGGTLGGSQAGARLVYRVAGGLTLSGRVYFTLRRTEGAELAAGIDWQPSPRLPVHLLAERRQRIGGEGRSAFALTLHGGASGRLPGGLRGEVYAQAGVVGVRSRDLFVDGAARVALPVGPVELGGGAWGAAQPGAGRLDAGPSLAWRLPARGANLRLQADWRFRLAGDAAPGSGPALTLAAYF